MAMYLLKKGAKADNEALAAALLNNYPLFLIKSLLHPGVDIYSASNNKDHTLVEFAVDLGKLEELQILVEHAGEYNKNIYHLYQAFKLSLKKDNSKITEFLFKVLNSIDYNSDTLSGTLLLTVLKVKPPEKCLKFLSDKGTDFNEIGNEGCSPLTQEIAAGRSDNIKALIECGADPKKPDALDRVPEEFAKVKCEVTILKQMRDAIPPSINAINSVIHALALGKEIEQVATADISHNHANPEGQIAPTSSRRFPDKL